MQPLDDDLLLACEVPGAWCSTSDRTTSRCTVRHGEDMSKVSYDPVELTRQLIRFDTVNPPGQERRCAAFLAELLHGGGFDISLRELGPERASLIATLPRASEDPPLVFTGHIDVVPLGTHAWVRDPFAGEVSDGRVHGRGSSDMKSGVAAFVCAAMDVARDSSPPNLRLVITAGEETGCTGATALVKEGDLGLRGGDGCGRADRQCRVRRAQGCAVAHRSEHWCNSARLDARTRR